MWRGVLGKEQGRDDGDIGGVVGLAGREERAETEAIEAARLIERTSSTIDFERESENAKSDVDERSSSQGGTSEGEASETHLIEIDFDSTKCEKREGDVWDGERGRGGNQDGSRKAEPFRLRRKDERNSAR